MIEAKATFCRICEALCGLQVDVEDGNVVDIRPDANHVATDGSGCPKGLKQHRILDSPDRLQRPPFLHELIATRGVDRFETGRAPTSLSR